jgi:hypothetical protein
MAVEGVHLQAARANRAALPSRRGHPLVTAWKRHRRRHVESGAHAAGSCRRRRGRGDRLVGVGRLVRREHSPQGRPRGGRLGRYRSGTGDPPLAALATTVLPRSRTSRLPLVYTNRSTTDVMFLVQLADPKDRYPTRLSREEPVHSGLFLAAHPLSGSPRANVERRAKSSRGPSAGRH